MINPTCEYGVSHLMWQVDGKGLASFQISATQKLDTSMLTKFNHVDRGQCWGMLIDRMYDIDMV